MVGTEISHLVDSLFQAISQVLGAMQASSSKEARRVPSERSEGHLMLFRREMLLNANLVADQRAPSRHSFFEAS